jgi:N-acetylmuramic acid 6-phosphate (MurNAc-6-P) etherase
MTRRPDDARIDDLLADSMVQAMMRADRVEPDALRTLMKNVSGRIARARDSDLTRGGGVVFKPIDTGASCAAACCW